MTFKFSCYDELFITALDEVDILIEQANENKSDEKLSVVFIKSALLLLAAKFEAFLENSISEFSDHLAGIHILEFSNGKY